MVNRSSAKNKKYMKWYNNKNKNEILMVDSFLFLWGEEE